jgi:hypothetical protein
MARNVVVERIEGPIGQGTAEKAVRVVGASDDTSITQSYALADNIRLLLIEQRLTNFLLVQSFMPTLDLDAIRNDIQREI